MPALRSDALPRHGLDVASLLTKPLRAAVTGRYMETRMRLLVCIYTCRQDAKYVELLRSSNLIHELQKQSETRIVDVHADRSIAEAELKGDELLLPCEEAYGNLSVKTHAMIAASLRFEFDFLLKIDSTVASYAEHVGSRHENITTLNTDQILDRIKHPKFFEFPYNGLRLAKSRKETFDTWARKKKIKGDYEAVFGGEQEPPLFFLGKFYSMRRDFCEFVAQSGGDTAVQHRELLGGCEDLMIGRLYSQWAATVQQRRRAPKLGLVRREMAA